MKVSIIAATVAGLLCWYGTTNSAIARDCRTRAGAHQNQNLQATDFSARRRLHHRYAYGPRYARIFPEPYYYGRPTEYRPYGLVPFFFGLSFPYRTW